MHNQDIVILHPGGEAYSAMQQRQHHPNFGIDLTAKTKRNVSEFHYFYNIESNVGLHQPNHQASVLLVQYMLSLFLGRYGSQQGMDRLSISGEVDAETDRGIRIFQEWLAWSPHSGCVPVDGVLAPVSGSHISGPAGPYVPPVLLLNRLWACIEPATFTNPSRLAGLIGEDVASILWASHPLRKSA